MEDTLKLILTEIKEIRYDINDIKNVQGALTSNQEEFSNRLGTLASKQDSFASKQEEFSNRLDTLASKQDSFA
ncbi:hypothetical protein, partial [Fictibacillus sp. BK138]|uniref:hypothetical protein n=1 Tax=Fictibacillus sp. BK138 TaxID=2512121 RepID=UPI0013EE953A